MTDILFAHSYFLRLDPKQWRNGLPYPPLGTLYAAALMRAHGYRVTLFDSMCSLGPDEIAAPLRASHPDFFILFDDGFNYLTKMCLTNMREAAFSMIRQAAAFDCRIIVCSSDAADHYDRYLEAGADFAIIGEGEQTLLELVEALERDIKDFSVVQGIAYLSEGSIVRTAPRPLMRDLDSLPLPAWDLLNMRAYRDAWMPVKGYFSVNMATTRGCPFKCNWCAKPIYGNRYHSRSPENVLMEIKTLAEQVPFDHIWFCDDIFGLKPGWVKSFADLTEQAGMRLRFKIQSRADLLVQENYVRDLARAGCETVWMGAESGSQKILDAMDKGTTIRQIREATVLLKRYGIKPAFFIQFGYPGETWEDIALTIRLINEMLPHEIGISISYPLPGTPFYERVRAEMSEKSNWTDSDELKLMFRNTFPAAFYKQLHRYVHKSYRQHLALESVRRLAEGFSMKDFKKAASLAYYLPAAFLSGRRLRHLETEGLS